MARKILTFGLVMAMCVMSVCAAGLSFEDVAGEYTGVRYIMGSPREMPLVLHEDGTYDIIMAGPFGEEVLTSSYQIGEDGVITLVGIENNLLFSADSYLTVDVENAIANFIEADDGNQSDYGVDKIPSLEEDTALTGKTIYWLGSSVTVGMASGNESMADYIAKRNNCTCVKEAVSGTTLFDSGEENSRSYVARMKNGAFDPTASVDVFVVQISTNDCKYNNIQYWGQATENDVKDLDAFDISTTMGAVEYIIAYAQNTWHCPVVFYSGTPFEGEVFETTSENYGKLVEQVKALTEKWDNLYIVDLFGNEELNAIDEQTYNYYMNDGIHPKRAGYLLWWTPAFEQELSKLF